MALSYTSRTGSPSATQRQRDVDTIGAGRVPPHAPYLGRVIAAITSSSVLASTRWFRLNSWTSASSE